MTSVTRDIRNARGDIWCIGSGLLRVVQSTCSGGILGGGLTVARRQLGRIGRLRPQCGRLRRAHARRRHTDSPGGRLGSRNQRDRQPRRKATTAQAPPSGGPHHGYARIRGARHGDLVCSSGWVDPLIVRLIVNKEDGRSDHFDNPG
jgi:hypothetical protein